MLFEGSTVRGFIYTSMLNEHYIRIHKGVY